MLTTAAAQPQSLAGNRNPALSCCRPRTPAGRMEEGRKEGKKDGRKNSLVSYAEKFCACAKLLQSCPIFCDPMDCNPPGSSVYGILQAILKWVAMLSSRGSFQLRDQIHISYVSFIARHVLSSEKLYPLTNSRPEEEHCLDCWLNLEVGGGWFKKRSFNWEVML